MQLVNINDLAEAFNKIALGKRTETYPKGIKGYTPSQPGRITINYRSSVISSGSKYLSHEQNKAYKKAVKLLKENPSNPDFLGAFNILVNEGKFEIYPD
jgi:hypothetical protein